MAHWRATHSVLLGVVPSTNRPPLPVRGQFTTARLRLHAHWREDEPMRDWAAVYWTIVTKVPSISLAVEITLELA